MHRADAAAWYQRAHARRAQGDLDGAITAFRRAATRDPEDPRYVLELADALASAHHGSEARQALLGLRDANPEDRDVNLRLARLYRSEGDVVLARRYYQNTLTSLWARQDVDRRRSVRLELIRFLLDHDDRSHALSALLELTGSLPDDPDAQLQAADLLLRAGDSKRALDGYIRTLRLAPANARALAGAGEASFDLGDYAQALRYLRQASGGDRVAHLRAIAELVLSADPLARRISADERRRRLTAGPQSASASLEACLTRQAGTQQAPDATLQALQAEAQGFAPRLASREGRDADTIEEGMDILYRIEQNIDRTCGASSDTDRALLLIGRRHDLP